MVTGGVDDNRRTLLKWITGISAVAGVSGAGVHWYLREDEYANQDPSMSTTRPDLKPAGLKAGDMAPYFEAAALDGRYVSLTGLLGGRAVLLSFSSSTCYPCLGELPALNRLHAEYGPRGLRMVAVYADVKADAARNLAERAGIEYPVVCDERGLRGPIAESYGVGSVPEHWLIGPDGRIIDSYVYVESDAFQGQLRTLFED